MFLNIFMRSHFIKKKKEEKSTAEFIVPVN